MAEGSRGEVFQNQEQIPRSLRSLGMIEKIVSSRSRVHGRSRSRSIQSEAEGTSPERKDLGLEPFLSAIHTVEFSEKKA